MKMTRVLGIVVLGGVVAAGIAAAERTTAQAKSGMPSGKFVQLPAGDLKYEEFYPGGPLESFIIGSKEAKHGPTAFFIKFKGGFDSGWHVRVYTLQPQTDEGRHARQAGRPRENLQRKIRSQVQVVPAGSPQGRHDRNESQQLRSTQQP